MRNVNSHTYNYNLLKDTKPYLRYDSTIDFSEWKKLARSRLKKLLGLPFEKVKPNIEIEGTWEHDGYSEIRFTFQSEKNYYVPCHFLTPSNADSPVPLVICTSGHGGGMHVALGRAKNEADRAALEEWPHRATALRAVSEGCCALVLETRNFGECSLEGYGTSCTESAKIALLMGRTAIGERVWDIQRALDVVEANFPQADMNRIICSGNSGGGTTTYYSACLDDRIGIAAPSCSICTFEDSIAAMPHCMCNFIPEIAKYFDMGDLAGLIAPRRLIVAAGQYDNAFPIHGVKKAFEQIKHMYQIAQCEDNCVLVIGDLGHYNYADLIWPEIKKSLVF